MNRKSEAEEGLGDAPCWASLSASERNAVIGKLIGGDVIQRPYMARDGKYLWACMITGQEAMERNKWLAEQQATEKAWERFRKDFDERITAEDRGKITIEIEEHHLRYSDTPGGGWCVIEALYKACDHIMIATTDQGWEVVAVPHGGEDVSVRSVTMEDAACQMALLILPNSIYSYPAESDINPSNP